MFRLRAESLHTFTYHQQQFKLMKLQILPGFRSDTQKARFATFETLYKEFLRSILGEGLFEMVWKKPFRYSARPRIGGESVSTTVMGRWSNGDIQRSALHLPPQSGRDLMVISVLIPDNRRGFLFWIDMILPEESSIDLSIVQEIRRRIMKVEPVALPQPPTTSSFSGPVEVIPKKQTQYRLEMKTSTKPPKNMAQVFGFIFGDTQPKTLQTFEVFKFQGDKICDANADLAITLTQRQLSILRMMAELKIRLDQTNQELRHLSESTE